jgi:transposase-like protein
MDLFSHACPCCDSNEVNIHCRYDTQNHGKRIIYCCQKCDVYFSESFATPMAGLRTPLSRITQILKARSEGMGLNATARTFEVSKKSVIDWEHRLGGLKATLVIYSLIHRFIHQVIEGDELYTKVAENMAASDSEGWTIVLMEQVSRFLWELQCGRKDKQFFTVVAAFFTYST